MALERPGPIDVRALFRPVSGGLVTLLRGLPPDRWEGPTVAGAWRVRDVGGASGGRWTLSREDGRWTLFRGEAYSPAARVRLSDDTAWKLLFNALSEDEAARQVQLEGRAELGRALLRARSVIV